MLSTSTKIRDSSQIQINISSDSKLEGRYYLLDQKHDNLQCMFCCLCEGSNEYSIAQSDPNFSVFNKKGYIREQSDCISRVVCVCNRPFSAKMKLYNQETAVAHRPCKCWLQWMPCAQNTLQISNKSGRIIGILKVGCWCLSGNIYKCADALIQIHSPQTQQLLYTIQGSYCQKSICCPWLRCCYCPNVQYDIMDKVSLKVGKISNIYNGCVTECFSRTSKFGIQMPQNVEEDHKILLIYGAMYLDYLRYDTPYCFLGFR